MNPKSLFLLVLSIAGTINAISFRQYYDEHTDEIDKRVASGTLLLGSIIEAERSLTDLDGLEDIPRLNELTHLDISNTKIVSVPDSICNLTALQVLSLNYNYKLRELPACIGNLRSLESLYLHKNWLTSIPESICQLPSLTTLTLQDNRLTAFPACLYRLPKLIHLNVDENPFKWKDIDEIRLKSAWFDKLVTRVRDGALGIKMIKALRGGLLLSNFKTVDIPKIRDEKGNNLLQLLLLGAQDRISNLLEIIDELENNSPQETPKLTKMHIVKLVNRLCGANTLYLSSFDALRTCGEECIKKMMVATNDDGKTVDDLIEAFPTIEPKTMAAMVRDCKPGNEFYEAVKRVRSQLLEKEEKEEKSMSAARALTTKPTENSSDF